MSTTEPAVPEARVAIAGTVRTSVGAPVAEAVVMIVGDSPSHHDLAALTDRTGRFHFASLVPGRYTFLVNVGNHPAQNFSVEAAAGKATEANFQLRA